jgi:hypothetical protein
MYLKAEEVSHLPIVLTDGNGHIIRNCIDIDTRTGTALVFIDFDKPSEWPEHWRFGHFIGVGGGMKVIADFKLPITVTTKDSGIVIEDELQLIAVSRFEALGKRIDSKAKSYKDRIDNGFVNLWAELGMAKAGIR